MAQVITIHADGQVSTLRQSKGRGVNLSVLSDRVEVERVSEILWDEAEQKWFVKFVSGPMAGQRILTEGFGGACFFDDYEDAVEAEIEVLNYVRLQGVL